ncbi:putative ABC transporter permease [Desulfitobacterium sp. AusDCA]|uniref:putative ABC transporter permease n=1 Tax=Desulfitobacterium sp. AusDCA TaxID=3240383 RepID=UPI003DA787AA
MMEVRISSLSRHRGVRFLIYGFLGLTLEVIYTGLASLLRGDWSMHGFTFLVMLPIYGLAVFLEPIHHKIKFQPWWIRGFIYLTLIWGIEYLSGWILSLILGSCPWVYRDPLNINGWITLRMAPEWFLAGLGFEIIHDSLET